MPPTRRAAGSTRARHGPAKGQSTLSFSNRVSKSVSRQDTKKSVVSPISHKRDDEDIQEVTKVDVEPEEPVEVEKETEGEAEVAVEEEEEEQAPVKSEAELRAEKISDAQIAKYWQNIRAQNIAPQVHVEDVSFGEKILRHFDVSLHYGVSCLLFFQGFVPPYRITLGSVSPPKQRKMCADSVLLSIALRRYPAEEAMGASGEAGPQSAH